MKTSLGTIKLTHCYVVISIVMKHACHSNYNAPKGDMMLATLGSLTEAEVVVSFVYLASI